MGRNKSEQEYLGKRIYIARIASQYFIDLSGEGNLYGNLVEIYSKEDRGKFIVKLRSILKDRKTTIELSSRTTTKDEDDISKALKQTDLTRKILDLTQDQVSLKEFLQ